MSGSNYDQVLAELQTHGLLVTSLELDTPKPVRVRVKDRGPEKRGWYSLHTLNTRDGSMLVVGAYGIFEGADSGIQRIKLDKDRMSTEQVDATRARIIEDRKRAEAQVKARQKRAAEAATAMWVRLNTQGDCEYLRRKGLHGPHGGRFSPKSGELCIPLQDNNGRIHGLQVIYSNPETIKRKGRDKDFWPTGLAKRGNYYLMGLATFVGVVLVAEGFATAATLHEATQLPVVVAFDAGNLLPVVQNLRKRYKSARILVCADDDYLQKCLACGEMTTVETPDCSSCGQPHGKGNAGVTNASAAALAVGGAAWVAPRFGDRGGKKLTDFNDLATIPAGGIQSVARQIEAKLEELGWADPAPAPHAASGEAGASPWHFDIDVLLRQFVLVYGTETVFDGKRRRVIGLGPLRAAAGKALVREWLENKLRRTVEPEQVVFDPVLAPDDPDVCNLWGGWPTRPKAGSCELLLELLEFLCSGEDNGAEVFLWIQRWLAYPIQHPGAKMQTSLLMHGPEGTGKNTFFGVVRQIYGRYGGIFGQTELESQFNGWASGKLFMIGNEVVTRVELYHQQGRLKNMITEPEWMVNEKNLPARMEANHCNFVFFSNRADIAKIDPNDRRYVVIWTPPAAGREFYLQVADEIRNGGIEALHHHLATLDLGDFHPHTPPPRTRSKDDLVELSMDSTERFWRLWVAGLLPVLPGVCRTSDLYEAYQLWARKEGVPRAAPSYVLLGTLKKKPGVTARRLRHAKRAGGKGQSTVLELPPSLRPPGVDEERWHKPDNISAEFWLLNQFEAFRDELSEWRDDQ